MLPGLMLVGVVLCAAAAARWGRLWVVPLVVACLGWFLVNKSMEGRTLFTVTPSHGLTSGDLAGIAGLVVAVLVVVPWSRFRGPR